MRDIKFRGFDTELKKWIYGYYVKHIPVTACMFSSEEERKKWYEEYTKHLIVFDGFSDWWMSRDIKASDKIDVESIGQFTDLTDINGKEIFEGDIISCKVSKNIKVFWNNGSFKIKIKKLNSIITMGLEGFLEKYKCKIVGNVYENPELLNDEKEKI